MDHAQHDHTPHDHPGHGASDAPGPHDAHDAHQAHDAHGDGGVDAMAVSATLHCLTGCAIGEIVGMLIGTGAGLDNAATIAISVALAFAFGYTLSMLPVVKGGLPVRRALRVVLAADTLSIATMEVVDNLVVAVIPGAMDAGLVNVVFWVSLMLSLVAAFLAAYPVNRFLLRRGKGHALTHGYAHGATEPEGFRRLIPSFPTASLVAVIVAFLLGGLVVSIADRLDGQASSAGSEPGASSGRTSAGIAAPARPGTRDVVVRT